MPLQKLLSGVESVTEIVDEKNITVPNNVIYVRFSKPFLKEYFCKQFRNEHAVHETMFGAAVRGQCRLDAHTELQLVDDATQVNAILSFRGETAFKTTSYPESVRIHCQGKTQFNSKKRLSFDGVDVVQSPPTTWAETKSQITGIDTDLRGLRRNIVLRVAERRAAEVHQQSEQITSQRTKSRVEAAFSEAIKERADSFTEELKDQYAKLPFEGRFAIKEIQCSTTPDMLQIVVVGRGEKEPLFVPPPERIADQPDIEVHFHTALVQKAILDAGFREALQSAVTGLVERPIKLVANAARKANDEEEPKRKLEFHWLDGETQEWLTLAWRAKETHPTKPDAVVVERVTAQ